MGPGMMGQGGQMGPGTMGQGGQMGPGMMGQGGQMGPGRMGQGGQMGPGMMGQGGQMGPGMMGQGGQMGPGMMGQGGQMGPGTMGQGGQMGPGMRGQGGQMGPGMMGGGMMGPMMQGGMMGRDCPMMGMAMGEGDGSMHATGRIAFLKAELGITEKQKPAFEDYADALKKNLEGMKAMRASMMSNMKSGTAAERLDGRIKAMEGRLATLKEVKPALDRLYGTLSDEQKKKADEVLTGMGCMM
jgi:hypothetical protein